MTYSNADLIKFKLQRSKEALEEAKLLSQNNHWNTVASRLYYSAFYSISALFVKHGLKAHSHSGTKSEFHKSFIKTNLISEESGFLFTDLFNKRQEGDYEDFLEFTKADIEPLIKQVEEFNRHIEQLLLK